MTMQKFLCICRKRTAIQRKKIHHLTRLKIRIYDIFWDGGLLSNTPFREVLQAHEDYWVNVQKCDEIPDLEIYLINLHPSKIDNPIPPMDHDGVKSRQNDITFCDRSSHYDENMAHMISNYKDLGSRLKDLADRAISNSNDPQLREEFESILAMPTKDSGNYADVKIFLKVGII
jgi:NTE family protein